MKSSSSNFSPDPNLLISVATLPVLMGLIGGRMMSQTLIDLGRASEEIFRGDRLPVLHFSTAAYPPTNPE
jgi:hypothetical protein